MCRFPLSYYRYVLMLILSEKSGGKWGEVGGKWGEVGRSGEKGGERGDMARNGDRNRGS